LLRGNLGWECQEGIQQATLGNYVTLERSNSEVKRLEIDVRDGKREMKENRTAGYSLYALNALG
jgi:hypothetical protein